MRSVSPVAPGSQTVGVERGGARLILVFAASLVPVAAAVALGHYWPVFLAACSVSAVAIVLGWVRGDAVAWRDAVLVFALAALTALSQPAMGVWTLAGGLGAVSLLRACSIAMPWGSWRRGRWWVGCLFAAPVGGTLGLLNLVGARNSGNTDRVGASAFGLLDALRAAVSEELGMRLYLLAICVDAIGLLPRTRGEHVLTYLVLIVPHAAIHFIQSPDLLVEGTITLSLVFGLPLAFLLKRFGLAPAVLAHAMIDGVRWAALGM